MYFANIWWEFLIHYFQQKKRSKNLPKYNFDFILLLASLEFIIIEVASIFPFWLIHSFNDWFVFDICSRKKKKNFLIKNGKKMMMMMILGLSRMDEINICTKYEFFCFVFFVWESLFLIWWKEFYLFLYI